MLARLLSSQGEKMSGFCPQWVFSACIGMVLKDFLEKDIPLDMLSRKYGKELSEKYDEINPIQIAAISEDIVRILAEVEAGSDAVNYINGFIYFTVNFESIGKKRSRKLLLGSIFDPEKDLNYDDKIIVSKIPLTYCGTDVVTIENTDNERSVFEPSRMPDITPMTKDIGIVINNTQNIRIPVWPSLGQTTSLTGFLKCVEYPKSPVTAFPSHSVY